MIEESDAKTQPSPFDNPAFRSVLRKLVDTPKAEVEQALAEQKTERMAQPKTVKAK